MKLPAEYSKLSPKDKEQARIIYAADQRGLCMHCSCPLNRPPPEHVRRPIDWGLFPKGFLNNPLHLQHNHDTDMTEGVVHAYCNAVLWQYHGR